jgi:hypothetical protein
MSRGIGRRNFDFDGSRIAFPIFVAARASAQLFKKEYAVALFAQLDRLFVARRVKNRNGMDLHVRLHRGREEFAL